MIATHNDEDQYGDSTQERPREPGDFGLFENVVLGVLVALVVIAAYYVGGGS